MNCFEKHNLPDLAEVFKGRLKEGMSEHEMRMEGLKVAKEYHEKLFGEMEGLKKEINPKYKPEKLIEKDNSKEIEQVQADFKKQVEEEKAAEVPVTEITGGELTGVTHAETDKVAQEMGLPTYEEKPETIAEWDAEATKQINEDPERVNKLLAKLKAGKEPDKVEQRIMAKYLASLKEKFNATKSDAIMMEYARAKKLSDEIGGREIAKSLVARKPLEPVEDSLADFVYKEMEDNNAGLPLDEKQKATVTKEYEEFKSKKDAYDAYVKQKDAELAKREADLAIKKQSKPKGEKKTSEDYKAERKTSIERLKELKQKEEQRLKDLGIHTMGANFTFTGEMAKEVGKIVKSLVSEGIDKLEEVVKHVHAQLKDIFPEITEGDVTDIIAGKYTEKKPTVNEVRAKVQDIRTEAKLIGQLEDVLFGKGVKSDKANRRKNIRAEKLRQQIRSLQDEKIPVTKDKAVKYEQKSKLDAIKTRLKNELDKYQDKLKEGNLEPDVKKEPIKLDAEGQKLRDALIKTKIDIEVARIERKYQVETKKETAYRVAGEVLNMPRTIMSSMDFSAPLRQGLVAVTAHPVQGIRAMAKMFQAAKSQKVFDRWFYDLHESPQYKIMQEAGLAITDPHDPKLAAKEEAFMNNMAQKIPFIGRAIKYGTEGKSIGGLISGSERAYVLFLNKIRADVFNKGAAAFEANGKTIHNSPELYKALAEHVNNITGRGGLHKHLEVASPLLNTVFFAPRLISSRINLLTNFMNPRFYKKVPIEVRKMYFADMAKFAVFGAATLGLAKAAGLNVEWDPRSSDGLKIKSGDTRYDILGGFQQYIRLISEMVTGTKKNPNTGDIKELNGEGAFGESRGDVALRFMRGKLAPVPGTIIDAVSGHDMMGNKIVYDQGLSINSPYKKEKTWVQEYLGNMVPLIANDISDAFQSQGIKSVATVGLPAAFGVGTQSYSSNDERPKRPKEEGQQGKPHKKKGAKTIKTA